MNKTAKIKLIFILILLLIINLTGLAYWYFFIYKCKVLPSQYQFLEGFVVENNCREKEFLVNGYVYNAKIDGNNFVFDLNSWNKENRSSVYKSDLSLNLDLFENEEVKLSQISNLSTELKIRISSSGDIKSWSLIPIKLENGTYTKVIESIYENLVTFNKNENKLLGAITTEVFKGKNKDGSTEILYHNSDSLYDLTLYKLWIDSFFMKNADDKGINGYSKILSSNNLSEIALNFLDERENVTNARIELTDTAIAEGGSCPSAKEALIIEEKSYLQKHSLGCTLVEEIYQNGLDENVKALLSNEFCNIANVKKDIESMTTTSLSSYTEEDLLQSINIDRISKKTNYVVIDEMLPLENYLNFIADTFIIQNNYPNLFDNQALNIVKLSVIDQILYRENFGINDLCTLAYSTKVASQYTKETFYKDVLNSIKTVLLEDITNTSKLFDESSYASFLCTEVYKEDEDLKEFLFSRIWKSIYLNLYDEQDKKGLWEDDGYYNIRTNTRFLKLLLENYEKFN